MALDTKSLSQLISDFRAISQKDAISPESLGYILQRIADMLAQTGTTDTQMNIINWYNTLSAAATVVSNIRQDNSDRNDVLLTLDKMQLADGVVLSNDYAVIKQATTERAGAMRAQQVTDLNNARKGVAALETSVGEINQTIADLQATLGLSGTNSTTNVINTAQIAVAVVNDQLHVLGASKLLDDGYIPYIFRHTRKRNQYKDKDKTPEYRAAHKYGPKRKGWHLFGSRYTAAISGEVLAFSTKSHQDLAQQSNIYSTAPAALMPIGTNAKGLKYVGWGKSIVYISNKDYPEQERMLRFRFGVGFAKPINPSRVLITTANLVSNLAEFSLVYDPNQARFFFSK